MYVWTTFQTIENGWDSNFFVGCSLFGLYAKCGSKQTWQTNYPLSLDQKVSLDEEIQHYCDYFQPDFKVEMRCLVTLCVHERKCA